jgi:hypothetical protein
VRTDTCRALLTAALGFLRLPPQTSALRALHAWLDSWAGVGHIVVGMERQGYAVSLAHVSLREGWRAAFYNDAMTSAVGFAVAPRRGRAVEQAAWQAIRRSNQGT